jgi:glycosyltransferase involved in cell wall biosynthesis
MISICLAAYNGGQYINIQLQSILAQIDDLDEIIIVDDCSTDETVKVIENIADKRIRLIKNSVNLGVVKSFEKAILNANSDIVFLSDQDDIWKGDKVSQYTEIFTTNKDVTLIISNAEIINGEGASTKDLFFKNGFPLSVSKNLISNHFLGCSIAFRKNAIKQMYPFPVNVPMHDWWIGLNHLIYGKVHFIKVPLLLYRRHGNNVTTGKRSALTSVMKWRFIMMQALIKGFLKS